MASRALTTRLMMTCSSWPWSAFTKSRSRPWTMSNSIFSPIKRRNRCDSSVRMSVRLSMRGCRVCWREKASSWRTRFAARFAFCLICMMSAKDWSPGRWRSSNRSEKPIIAVSRLLKSCAMPPASWPTACIFCDWENWSSRFFCSVVSMKWVIKPLASPTRSAIPVTNIEQTVSPAPPKRTSSGVWVPPASSSSLRASIARTASRSFSLTKSKSETPVRPSVCVPIRALKARLHSVSRPLESSNAIPTGASRKNRSKRWTERSSASAMARSRDR